MVLSKSGVVDSVLVFGIDCTQKFLQLKYWLYFCLQLSYHPGSAHPT